MRKQFHSGNILNKKFHLEMIRDLKADCAKRTEEVCSGFCNIGSGISLKRQKWHQKAKNCFLVFFLCSGWRKEGRQEQPLIDYKRAGMRETKWKLKTKKMMWSEKGVFTFLFCAFGKWSKKDSGERSENVHIHEFADCWEFAQERQLKEQFRQRRNTGILWRTCIQSRY